MRPLCNFYHTGTEKPNGELKSVYNSYDCIVVHRCRALSCFLPTYIGSSSNNILRPSLEISKYFNLSYSTVKFSHLKGFDEHYCCGSCCWSNQFCGCLSSKEIGRDNFFSYSHTSVGRTFTRDNTRTSIRAHVSSQRLDVKLSGMLTILSKSSSSSQSNTVACPNPTAFPYCN